MQIGVCVCWEGGVRRGAGRLVMWGCEGRAPSAWEVSAGGVAARAVPREGFSETVSQTAVQHPPLTALLAPLAAAPTRTSSHTPTHADLAALFDIASWLLPSQSPPGPRPPPHK